MLQRISLSTVKVRPTDRKIKKSVSAIQKTAEDIKMRTPVESRAAISCLVDCVKFFKNSIIHKAN